MGELQIFPKFGIREKTGRKTGSLHKRAAAFLSYLLIFCKAC